MGDFFSTWKFKVMLVLAIFLAGMMAYAGANGRLTAAPQELLSLVLTPVQWVSAKTSNNVSEMVDKYLHLDEIIAENEALRAENAELKDQMVAYDRVQAENEAYEKLLGIQEQNTQTTYVLGFVIGRDSLDSFGGFTINKGTLSGIARGDTVISEDGCLVGTVIEANLTSCKVLTILHPSFNAAGMVSRTRDNGILTGDSAYAKQGLCLFTNLTRDTLANTGDSIITTGLGGVYPPDIRIGSITEIIPESSGTSSLAVVAPGSDILSVKQVFVITDY